MSHALVDALWAHFDCASDRAVGKHFDLANAQITKYRSGANPVGAVFILRVYDITGWSIERIRELVADKSPRVTINLCAKKAPKQPKRRAKTSAQVKAPKKQAKVKTPKKQAKRTVPVAAVLQREPSLKRLTVTKAAKWTSTVHRVL